VQGIVLMERDGGEEAPVSSMRSSDGGSVSSGIVRPVEAGPEVRALAIFIGNWINEGHTVVNGAPGPKILTSDVYEWVPGGFFVVHTAYGLLAGVDVGGIEILGYDDATGEFRSWFFDSQGNASSSPLLHTDDSWIWQRETTRATSVFTDGGRMQTTLHERLEDGAWIPSMEVVLTKVG
jgi:hypothetical protein